MGADAFASDLNPVAVLLNKVVLEYIPKYGNAEIRMRNAEGEEVGFHGLAEAVRYWGDWIKRQAEVELAEFYPKDPDGATPIAYLWARTITCEGPGCGAEVPLMRSLWLAKKGERSVALRIIPDPRRQRVDFAIVQKRGGKWVNAADPHSEIRSPQFDGTVRRGSATCPVCGYTTPVASVRRQLKARRGGAADARLFCVVTTRPDEQGRFYRLPTDADLDAVHKAVAELERRKAAHAGPLSLVPDEEISLNEIRRISVPLYGMATWGDLFSPRQALTLSSLTQLVQATANWIGPEYDPGLVIAMQTCLALIVDREADAASSLCRWHLTGEKNTGTFGRQALGMVWDFCEVYPLSDSTGGLPGAVEWVAKVCDANAFLGATHAQVERASATAHPLPDDAANALVTDPPYYDAVPYAHLSDFFYVWLHRSLARSQDELMQGVQVPKDTEIVVDRPHQLSNSTHDIAYYEQELTKAFADGRRILAPDGIGTIVFASKTTASWEAILQAVVDAGWIITGSWPIDTEMEARVAAQGQARLASSIHLACRPRPDAEAAQSGISDQVSGISNIGDWRDVLAELPGRIHAWMPRLAQEGVVGADAIFACLGPALEIFSRYSRVEKASGDPVTLREYLEHVWAAVSREALALIFEGADTSEFEEDARLTAMWLWTLGLPSADLRLPIEDAQKDLAAEQAEIGDDDQSAIRNPKSALYALEYDAARKIAQGLGAHLERLTGTIEVKGDTARLLTVAERTRYLFGKDEAQAPGSRRPKPQQLGLFAALEEAEEGSDGGWGEKSAPKLGNTVLDRIHQAMILFAAGRSEALKRFLVAEGAGKDVRFWRLAQALSALYPAGSEEKRWVDGVLARKKGLGF